MSDLSPAHLLAQECNATMALEGNASHLTQVGEKSHCCKQDDGAEAWSVLLGVLMGLIGSVLINIGQNLQARAMQSDASVKDKPCTSRTWVIGLSIFITGSLLNFAAFTFASASILVPIEAVQFVVNVAFNKFVNHKPISCRMLFGVSLTIVGTVICVAFGSTDARCFDLADLIDFWTKPLWWGYLVLSFGVAAAAHVVHERYARAAASGHPPRHALYVMPISFAVSSALFGGSQVWLGWQPALIAASRQPHDANDFCRLRALRSRCACADTVAHPALPAHPPLPLSRYAAGVLFRAFRAHCR